MGIVTVVVVFVTLCNINWLVWLGGVKGIINI